MKSDNQNDQDVSLNATPEETTSTSRRRLVRGALVGAPLLLALKSTPVLAANCKLPSGFSTSGNLSRNGGATCASPVPGPAYWQARVEKVNDKEKNQEYAHFKGTGVRTDTPFSTIFGGGDRRTLLEALNTGNLQALVVAAHLNAHSSKFVPGVSHQDIVMMWQGSYTPPGGRAWSAGEAENYLRYTMGLPVIPF